MYSEHPVPCPTCGFCPCCGRRNPVAPTPGWYPDWTYRLPYQPTYQWGCDGTTPAFTLENCTVCKTEMPNA